MKISFKQFSIHVILVPLGDAHDIVVTELASTGNGSLAGDLCH
jgi:hypothetical protein